MNTITISQYNRINLENPEKLKKLKQVCNDFESEVLNFFLKEALNPKSSIFPQSPGEKIYRSMYQEALSKELSGNFGYSELLFNYLKDKT
ncbi:MAG: rod-binding protein [Nautiliaceae bacterium]